MPQPLYTAGQTRELDRLAISAGTPGFELMLRAGKASYKLLRERWPQATRLAILCGAGNNGGDGLVVAGLACADGLSVQLRLVGGERARAGLQGEAKEALAWATVRGAAVGTFDPQEPLNAELVVDALLGTGLDRPVSAAFGAAIAQINQSGLPVFALDLPSGLNADTGQPLGCAVRADLTLSFIGRKRGLFTAEGAEFGGERLCDPLGVEAQVFQQLPVALEQLEGSEAAVWLPRRARNSHKGDFGRLLLIGGDHGMGGAIAMAGEAALRSGAGLVSIATRMEHLPACNARCPELMVRAVRSGQELQPLLENATALVIGPGLGQSAWSGQLLHDAQQASLPMVLDADALNLLNSGQLVEPKQRDEWILTPHPGEAARLLGCSVADIQADRFAAVTELQHRYGGVVVLKGAGTLIKSAEHCYLCSAGNPGMATGGMGDVLSGVMGALLAQGLKPLYAAALGVQVHAQAADRLALERGERGLLASDLPPVIRELLNP